MLAYICVLPSRLAPGVGTLALSEHMIMVRSAHQPEASQAGIQIHLHVRCTCVLLSMWEMSAATPSVPTTSYRLSTLTRGFLHQPCVSTGGWLPCASALRVLVLDTEDQRSYHCLKHARLDALLITGKAQQACTVPATTSILTSSTKGQAAARSLHQHL